LYFSEYLTNTFDTASPRKTHFKQLWQIKYFDGFEGLLLANKKIYTHTLKTTLRGACAKQKSQAPMVGRFVAKRSAAQMTLGVRVTLDHS
jgi:hypothetical protein